jgi:hypothetical protein
MRVVASSCSVFDGPTGNANSRRQADRQLVNVLFAFARIGRSGSPPSKGSGIVPILGLFVKLNTDAFCRFAGSLFRRFSITYLTYSPLPVPRKTVLRDGANELSRT